MEFISFVGSDRENWGQIKAVMNRIECDKVILVGSKEVKEFPVNDKTETIIIDSSKPLVDFKEDIMKKIKPLVSGDFEVAVSLASGNGKEHMALISALLSIPLGIRLVVFTKKGIEVIN